MFRFYLFSSHNKLSCDRDSEKASNNKTQVVNFNEHYQYLQAMLFFLDQANFKNFSLDDSSLSRYLNFELTLLW